MQIGMGEFDLSVVEKSMAEWFDRNRVRVFHGTSAEKGNQSWNSLTEENGPASDMNSCPRARSWTLVRFMLPYIDIFRLAFAHSGSEKRRMG